MLFIHGILIHTSQLAWAIGHTNNVLTLWTQLFEIIRRFKTVPEPDIVSKGISLVDSTKSIGTDLDKENTFNFLSPNRRRYSVDTLVLAFTLFHKSNAWYTVAKYVMFAQQRITTIYFI